MSKRKYTIADLDWMETHLSEMKKYVEANPLSTIKDRTEVVMSAKGTPVIKVVATKEAQIRELRSTLKEALIMIRELEELREQRATKEIEVRGGGQINGLLKEKFNAESSK